MKMIRRTITISLLCMMLLSVVVLADERQPPHQLFGDVLTNGKAAPDGLLVEARSGNVVLQSTRTQRGTYGYEPDIFYLPFNSTIEEGIKITLYIKDKDDVFHEAGSSNLISGKVEELDLSATGNFGNPSNDNDDDNDGGRSSNRRSSSSSPGGGYIPPPSVPEDDNITDSSNSTEEDVAMLSDSCTPDWYCSEWTECLGEKQTRTCVDDNDCGSDENKPEESRDCNVIAPAVFAEQEEAKPQEGLFNRITGFVVGESGTVSGKAVLFGLLITMVLVVVYKKRRRIRRLFKKRN